MSSQNKGENDNKGDDDNDDTNNKKDKKLDLYASNLHINIMLLNIVNFIIIILVDMKTICLGI